MTWVHLLIAQVTGCFFSGKLRSLYGHIPVLAYIPVLQQALISHIFSLLLLFEFVIGSYEMFHDANLPFGTGIFPVRYTLCPSLVVHLHKV